MSADVFRFKHFAISQHGAAMKVGTDGVLVGAWASAGDICRRILDVGTGTGVIALMVAQRWPEATVTGIESDTDAAECARRNAAASQWSDRIEIVHDAVQNYFPEERFDLIVSNPPYYDVSLPCPDSARSNARHTHTLTFAELCVAARRLLLPDGRFAVIVPSESVRAFVAAGDMHLVRRCDVKTTPTKPPKRTMLEFSTRFSGATQCDTLVIGDGSGGYDDRYKALVRDFYLDF